MISAIDAYNIAQGIYPEELKYIEDTIRIAVEIHTTCCLIKEEISEVAEQVLKTAGYNVRVFSFHNGYITYINWANGRFKCGQQNRHVSDKNYKETL